MSPKEMRYGCKVENKVYFVKCLDELKILKIYTGYYLLVEIMDIMINQGVNSGSFSRLIYPHVAEKYGKSDCTIERNIRSLINKCWDDELMRKLKTYYPDTRKPTCREFIFLVKNYIVNAIT